jgi:hypothetical protein
MQQEHALGPSRFVDAAGVPQDRTTVLPKLRAATNAPIFSYLENYLGQGIVGGPALSITELGRRMAEAAVRILRGEVSADLKIPPLGPGAPQYDCRELRRWNISEGQLPAGSIVRFREPGMWQQYSSQITLVAGIMLVQVALIAGLLVQRRRRLHAEVQARQRAVAQFFRYTPHSLKAIRVGRSELRTHFEIGQCLS